MPKRPNPGLILVALLFAALIAFQLYRSRKAPTPELFDTTLTLTQALQQAQDDGRPVLVLATSDTCPPCQRLKRGPLTNPDVARLLTQRTIPVYLDVTRTVPDDAAHLAIRAIPVMLLIEDGTVTQRREGYQSATQLQDWLAGLGS